MALPADFSKIFGSTATGGLTPISDVNYAKGWEFVGSNPPTKNDFSYLQNLSDLKSQWLYSNKLQRANPFGDIKADGAVAVSTALENLGLGEAAKRDVGTGANQIPDMTSFVAGSGWCQLPNGKILQWGAYTGSAPSATINFPIPFPNTQGRVIISLSGTATNADGSYIIQDDNLLSRTSFSFRRTGLQSRFNWFCIGE